MAADDNTPPKPANHPAYYVPPKVWTLNKESGGRFAATDAERRQAALRVVAL